MTASRDPKTNLSRDSGQFSDTLHSPSDDGTIPPIATRQAIPAGASAARPLFSVNPTLSPNMPIVESPDASGPHAHAPGGLPPEADGANPLTLGPRDPVRQSDEGQPYLDDANPYGRALVNRQNRPMGGVGTVADPSDEERPHDRSEAPAS